MATILSIAVDTTSSIMHTYNNTPAANRVAIAARSIHLLGRRHMNPTAANAIIVVTILIVFGILILVFVMVTQRPLRSSPGSPAMPAGHVYGRNGAAGSHWHALGRLPRQSSRCERPHHRHLENGPLNSEAVSDGQSTASMTRPVPVVTRAPQGRDETESPPPPPCKQLPHEFYIAIF